MFGAESPRDEVDQASLELWKAAQGFICLRVTVAADEALGNYRVRRIIRIGQPTAADLAEAIQGMLNDEDGQPPAPPPESPVTHA